MQYCCMNKKKVRVFMRIFFYAKKAIFFSHFLAIVKYIFFVKYSKIYARNKYKEMFRNISEKENEMLKYVEGDIFHSRLRCW